MVVHDEDERRIAARLREGLDEPPVLRAVLDSAHAAVDVGREASAAASRAYVQQRKLEGRVGETRYPGAGFVGGTPSNAYFKPAPAKAASPSAYYNRWYGGWNSR